MIRVGISILFSIFTYAIFCQDAIIVTVGSTILDFEDTGQNKYVKIDADSIWQITKPTKPYFNSSYDGEYGIITDSNDYYQKNLHSSLQFKVNLEYCGDYFYLIFYHKYDFDMNNDGGFIEISYDNGISWNNIVSDTLISKYGIDNYGLYQIDSHIKSNNDNAGYTGKINEFSEVGFSISNRILREYDIDTFLFRFTIVSDSIDTNNEGWLLDKFIFGSMLVGIEDNQNSVIRIVPNPANNYISVISPDRENVKIDILNINGLMLSSHNTTTIDISGLSKGLYLLRIDDIYIKKLIIK